ncbi:MAG: serine hydrolase domain-containing protein [Ferruginibacter sp.]
MKQIEAFGDGLNRSAEVCVVPLFLTGVKTKRNKAAHFRVFRLMVVCIFLTINYSATGQTNNSQKTACDFSIIQQKIQGWVDSGYYNGASIIIAKDNKVIYKKYFGNYNPSTVAFIASAGKWLAAATIAALVDKGKLSWDDKVNKWLPEFKDSKGEATLRQLLSHTAGYPDYQPKGSPVDIYQTLKESVAHMVDLPADTLPGTKFKYGGLAMQVAGRMAEMATGKDWETIFQQQIAGPLQMRSTHFTPVDSAGGHAPMLGGGARTCLQDYANFLHMISNDGMFKGKRILSKAAIKEMQADQVGNALVNPGEYVANARGDTRKSIYGLGQWREETNANGEPVLISSPSWAGAYPWIDKVNNVYGFFLTRISNFKPGFSSFYASPVLPVLVRKVLKDNK